MNLLTNLSEIERTVKRFMKIIGDPFTKIITDFFFFLLYEQI